MAETTRELVATYRDAAAARQAITSLERHGIDAEHIRLVDAPEVGTPMTDEAQRGLDEETTSRVAKRSLGTSVVLALVLGALGALVGWFMSDGDSTAVLIGAAGGFMAGGALGFAYGGYSGLAVSSESFDTFEATGPTKVAVHVPDDQVIDLRDAIDATDPVDVRVS